MSLLLGLAFAFIYGAAGIPLGWLADRSSRRNLILAGVLVWGVGTLACGMAHSFASLFAARIVVGLGEAVLSPAAVSLISDYFPPEKRGRAVGVYFAGIAVGIGGSIFIGGAVLNLVTGGLLAHTALSDLPAWRAVFIVIGAPSLVWALAMLAVREPVRRLHDQAEDAAPSALPRTIDWRAVRAIAPVYAAVAIASLVDNAVGAWAPSLLIRRFHAEAAEVGVSLGLLLMLGYGGGMLAGGWLADRAAAMRGRRGKVELCLLASLLILPLSLALNAPSQGVVMAATAVYFAVSAVVTAAGLSAILDASPNRVRGLAMAISFFLNVAIGAGLGPTAVALAGERVIGAAAGLGPAITLTVAVCYALAAAALIAGRRTAEAAR
jgi:MFS family permease